MSLVKVLAPHTRARRPSLDARDYPTFGSRCWSAHYLIGLISVLGKVCHVASLVQISDSIEIKNTAFRFGDAESCRALSCAPVLLSRVGCQQMDGKLRQSYMGEAYAMQTQGKAKTHVKSGSMISTDRAQDVSDRAQRKSMVKSAVQLKKSSRQLRWPKKMVRS